MTSSSLLSKFLGQHQGGAGTRGSEVVTTASVYQSTVCQNTTDVVRKAMHPPVGARTSPCRPTVCSLCASRSLPNVSAKRIQRSASGGCTNDQLIHPCVQEMGGDVKHHEARVRPRSPVAHIAIISPKTSNASVPYVTSSLAAPVSEAAMFSIENPLTQWSHQVRGGRCVVR